MRTGRFIIFSAIALFLIPTTHGAVAPNDDFIAGYAAAVLKRDFKLDFTSLVVRDGVITLPVHNLTPKDRARVQQILSEIPGVTGVALQEDNNQQNTAVSSSLDKQDTPTSTVVAHSEALPTGFLPTGHLFRSLLADPRWAHFSASYRNYVGTNIDGNNNGSISLGETIPFYRANLGQTTIQWETGLQAANL